MENGRAAAESGTIGNRQCLQHCSQLFSLADRLRAAPHVLPSALMDASIAMRIRSIPTVYCLHCPFEDGGVLDSLEIMGRCSAVQERCMKFTHSISWSPDAPKT
jgi:hypothetical protein